MRVFPLSVLAAFTAPTVALAQDDGGEDFRGYIDQAKFFIKKKWYTDAVKQLELAVGTADGRIDPEVWFMLATVRFELGDLPRSRMAAERAHSYSRNDEQLEQAAAFAGYLREQYGIITVTAPYEGLAAQLDVKLTGILFDPEQKRYLERAVTALSDSKVDLPYAIGLPAGQYTVNGVQVTIAPGSETQLLLQPNQLQTGGPLAVKLAQVEVGLGISAWFGSSVENLLPTLNAHGSVSQPVGPLVVGLMLDWAPRAFKLHDGGLTGSLNAWTLGARVGVEITPIQGLILRPSLGYRYGYIPGIEMACETVGATFVCGNVDREMVIYAVGRAHIPMLEFAVSFLDRTRSKSVGVGVKTVVEHALGSVAAESTADLTTANQEISYSVNQDARAWSATGIRVLANIDFAF